MSIYVLYVCLCYVSNNVSCVKAEQFAVDVNLYSGLAMLEPGPRYLLILRVIVDSFRYLLEICHNRHLPKMITFSPFRIIFPINVMSACETACLNNLQSVSCPYGGNFLTFVFLGMCTLRCMKWAYFVLRGYWSCFEMFRYRINVSPFYYSWQIFNLWMQCMSVKSL